MVRDRAKQVTQIDDAFEDTLATLTAGLAETRNPWWIIAGAAFALVSEQWDHPQDIDVLCSPEDVRRLINTHGLSDRSDGGTGRFRSEVFARWELPVPVDLLGGFQVLRNGSWTRIAPRSRIPLQTAAGMVYVPDLEELIQIASLMGREKDLERIERLMRSFVLGGSWQRD